ncbi:MAG: alpha/beta hydrolase [Clostridia bacterium]|nr:alpha/beta hydrolase [Clostridia bacterium]
MQINTGKRDNVYDVAAGKVGVLMVHGIQGRPEQFRFLTETLPGDTLINCLLLPGHGAGVKQFRHSDQGIWLSAVIDAATDMRLKCDNIIFVGHSMGCLLGLIAEQNNPGLFSSMILLCCPFSIRLTFRYMKNNILSFQKEPTDPFVLATKEANSVSAKTPLAYISCLHPYMELLRMIRRVRRMKLPYVHAKYFFADRDEIVSPRSASIAKENGADIVHLLPNCGHHYFSAEAKKEIIEALQNEYIETVKMVQS